MGRIAVAALFVTLAAAELRVEGYETEKAGLLLIIALVGVGLWLALGVRTTRARLRHPLVITVALLGAAGVVSTIFSLDPLTSLFGQAHRGQGLLALLANLVLFGAAAVGGRWIAPRLTALLCCIAVPLCLFAWQTGGALGIERPGSFTGNPNYLASWIVLAVPLILGGATINPPTGAARWIYIPLIVSVVVLLVATLFVAASRGGVLALGGALVIGLMALAWVTRRWWWGALAVVVAAAGVIVIAYAISTGAGERGGLARLISVQDDIRMIMWRRGVNTILDARDGALPPLTNAQGEIDRYGGLRFIVGHGLDTLPLTQSRYPNAFPRSLLFDSFHNLWLDSAFTMGLLGLTAVVAIFVAALWMGARGLRRAPDSPRRERFLLVGLLAAVAARLIESQVSFATLASDPLWWLALGMIVSLTSERADADTSALATAPLAWIDAAVCASLMVVYSLGATIISAYITQATTPQFILPLAAAALLIGGAGALITTPADRLMHLLVRGAVGIGLIAVWAAAEDAFLRGAGSVVDAALLHVVNTGVVGDLRAPFILLAGRGVVICLIILAVWVLPALRPNARMASAALFITCGVAGAGLYAMCSGAAGILHGVGNRYAESAAVDSGARLLALSAYQSAAALPPPRESAWLDLAAVRLNYAAALTDESERFSAQALTDAAADAAVRWSPYVIHTQVWALYAERYEAVFGSPPAYSISAWR